MGGRSVAERVKSVQEKIKKAAERANRSPAEITLVGVSKKKLPSDIQEAFDSGLRDFGENYVQELAEKISELATLPVRWHFIGGLQRNKCKFIAGSVELIHSVDRFELAQEISKVCALKNKTQKILIQVNITGEATKGGVSKNELKDLVQRIGELPHVKVRGLMTFPPMYEDPERARDDFRRVKELASQLNLGELSMGSSHDYEVAIEEGSTIVRVGTEIFGERT